VLHAWRMIQARKLAMDVAQKIASEARQSNKPLKEVLADRAEIKVTRPPAFSWLTLGSAPAEQQMRPYLNRVEGVNMAGSSFMQAVFDLRKGEVATAFNEPKTDAFVIRMDSLSPSDAQLFKGFEGSVASPQMLFQNYMWMTAGKVGQATLAWQKEVETSAGLEWVRKPNEKNSAEDGGE